MQYVVCCERGYLSLKFIVKADSKEDAVKIGEKEATDACKKEYGWDGTVNHSWNSWADKIDPDEICQIISFDNLSTF